MKIRTVLASAIGAGALLMSFALPAQADEGSLRALGEGAPVTSDDTTTRQLEALAQTQTPAEVQAIVESGKPADILYDPIAEEYLAAKVKPLTITPFLAQLYAGCTTTSACAWLNGGKSPAGFEGTGSLATNCPGVSRVQAGSFLTTFWYGNTGVYVAGGQSVTLTSTINVNKVTRG
ncbi:hypothetical protein [Leifsonia sp. EB34]|uniref:hypothetical protein n=1 Tax=Leifsonia sp. EB34 TaxID=3156303 RepID=UPI003518A216